MSGNFFKGIMAGVIVGTVVGMIFDPMRSSRETNNMKKKAGRVFKTAGNIIDNLTDF
jgi:gas vesicle protein